MFRFRLALLVLLLVGTTVSGCGGGTKKKSSGVSLDDQYRKAMTEPDLAARASQLLTIAERQRQAGDVLGMEQSLSSAADAAKRIGDAKPKALALNRVAEALGRADRMGECKSLLREVSTAADGIEEPEIKVTALTRMAYTYGKHLKNADIATAYLKTSEEIADGISRPEGRIDALLEVALTCHQLELAERAKGVSDKSLAAARGLDDVRKRADGVASGAATLSKMGKTDEAQATFLEAEKLIGEIPDPMSRSYAWIHLSDQYKAASRRPDAQRALQQAENAADKVTDSSLRNPLLETIDRSRR